MGETWEYEARVKHKGRINTVKIFTDSDMEAQVQASMKGKVIAIRKMCKVNTAVGLQ